MLKEKVDLLEIQVSELRQELDELKAQTNSNSSHTNYQNNEMGNSFGRMIGKAIIKQNNYTSEFKNLSYQLLSNTSLNSNKSMINQAFKAFSKISNDSTPSSFGKINK